MSRELIASLLMLLLIAGAWWNIRAVDSLSGDMLSALEESEQAADKGDCYAALKAMDDALERWLKADSYTHIFIRHSEIDSTAGVEGAAALRRSGQLRRRLRQAALPHHQHTGNGASQHRQHFLRRILTCPAAAWTAPP